MSLRTIDDVRVLQLPRFVDVNGELVVLEQDVTVPFAIVRTFVVKAPAGAIRGHHAHKRCAQLMVCLHGSISVECDDSERTTTFSLDRPDCALLVPASIWATETYATDGAVLTVFCDRRYEADDYIREYESFLTWRRTGMPGG